MKKKLMAVAKIPFQAMLMLILTPAIILTVYVDSSPRVKRFLEWVMEDDE